MAPSVHSLDGREACRAALRAAFDEAAAAAAPELLLSDADYADPWPLGERAVVDGLLRWAGGPRRMTVLAARYDEVLRRHPRWVAFRRQWAHRVECHAIDDADAADVPSLLLVPGRLVVRILDRRHGRGLVSRQPADLIDARELFDAHLQRAVAAFPATTLGL